MRYIDMQALEMLDDWPPGEQPSWSRTPAKWRERLCKAEEELRQATSSKERSAVFKKYGDLWSAVKRHYRELSNNKCWYCETPTHPGEIDHFRPKAGVDKTRHPGYWWLAFDWRNWRYVCKSCNSENHDDETGIVEGKGNAFPLMAGEEQRIWEECDYDELEEENPVLLDPAELRDVQLLTFRRDGLPSATAADEQADDYRRATESIKIYHLDSSHLVRERKEIYLKVRNLVKKYQRCQRKWEMEHDRSAERQANDVMKDLGRMIMRKAAYSTAARAYLKGYRRDDPEWVWIDNLLTAPI